VNQAEGIRASALKSNWEKGSDKFRGVYPQIDWTVQLAYAEALGLGSRAYDLIPIN
jgi:uncharacterized Fe-S center protein